VEVEMPKRNGDHPLLEGKWKNLGQASESLPHSRSKFEISSAMQNRIGVLKVPSARENPQSLSHEEYFDLFPGLSRQVISISQIKKFISKACKYHLDDKGGGTFSPGKRKRSWKAYFYYRIFLFTKRVFPHARKTGGT